MKTFESARVRELDGRRAKKTKRLHCFNFSLIIGSAGSHQGYMEGSVADGWFTQSVAAVGRWLRIGFAPIFFVPVLIIFIIKKVSNSGYLCNFVEKRR